MRPEDQRGEAYKRPWDLPKVILNKARRSRGPWRISAFADFDRLTCYQTFIAVWPNDPAMTTVLAAILNGPLGKCFLFHQERRTRCHDSNHQRTADADILGIAASRNRGEL